MEIDPNPKGGLWDYVFNGFVKPDLIARVERGELPNPFNAATLSKFQVLFYPDGRLPKVRIDSEVRGIAEVMPAPGMEIAAGEAVMHAQLQSVGEVSLNGDDADCGHCTMFNVSGQWGGWFDFTRYKGRSRNSLKVARQYLKVAEHCRREKIWPVFLDTLWAAAELAAKALLFYHVPEEKIINTKSHGTVQAEINRQRKVGNVDPEHSESFNALREKRDKARYAHEEIVLDEATADKYLQDIRGLIDATHAKVRSVTDKEPKSPDLLADVRD